MAESFTASLKGFSEKAVRNAELILKQSAQEVFELAQVPSAKGGRMPVVTGFLRGSLTCGLNGSTSLTGPESYVLAVAPMRLGDIMEGGWTAVYALAMEYYGYFYMRNAAVNWQQIVAKNAGLVDSK